MKSNKLMYVVGCAVMLFLVLSLTANVFLYLKLQQANTSLLVSQALLSEQEWHLQAPIEESEDKIFVHVVGAVNKPGLYQVLSGARAFEALEAAGGANSEADLFSINLAAPLTDGQQLNIPKVGEAMQANSDQVSSHGVTDTLININTADAALLETLPGIGPAKAQAIIDYRNSNGKFVNIEDVLAVKGIGQATFANIKSKICAR